MPLILERVRGGGYGNLCVVVLGMQLGLLTLSRVCYGCRLALGTRYLVSYS